ncbi:MAG: hypothetical protein M3Z16_12205 [Pseudomonadota bacterium]|nr:hypothetical protein [Pseudomonadota bacterium]
MQTNPYAPPKAEVDDVVSAEPSPPLWNPNAAASWSLVFSPAFGAFLHMKNWQALGEPRKAASSKAWFIASIAVLIGSTLLAAFLPDSMRFDRLSRIFGLVLLLSWYFSSGKEQVAVVKSRFGKTYLRRGWTKPLLIALGVFIGFIAFVIAIAAAAGSPQDV